MTNNIHSKKKKGVTLIEVLVAISVLAICAVAASSLIITTIRSTAGGKNYLIAVNLAREGIEGVRAIRDTNLLKFSFNTEQCWDVLDADQPGECETLQKISSLSSTNYRLQLNADYKWQLAAPTEGTADFSPESDASARQFYLLEPDANGILRHGVSGKEYLENETSFYRAIAVQTFKENAGQAEAIHVIAAVKWMEGNDTKTVNMETTLTSYNE